MKNNAEAEQRNHDLELLIQYLEDFFDEIVELESQIEKSNQKVEKRLNSLINEDSSRYMSINYQSKVSSLFSNASEVEKQITHMLANTNALLDDATKTRYWDGIEI